MVHHSGLRKMTLADVPSVYEIEKLVTSAPWSEKIFADCISVGYECWVCAENKKVVGYGVLSYAGQEAHILNLAIAPDHQRQGFGQKMLQNLLNIAKIHGSEEIFLEVRPSNQPARELYSKFNFVEIGLRKDYYVSGDGSEKEDALTLALPLW